MTSPFNTLFQTEQPSSQLRSQLGRLPDAERRVAEVLLAAPGGVIRDSVGHLARRAEASPATVIRLSRRLGYEGFAALKIAMAQEAGGTSQFGLAGAGEEGGGPVYRQVMAADVHSIRAASHSLDADAFAAAHGVLSRAREVLFAGVGSSASVAALAAFRFSALGVRASSSPDALSQHLRAGTLGEGDVCVAISHTGESRDTIEAVRTAGRNGARTLGVTSFAGSPLTEAVESALICAGEDDAAHQELFANPVAVISVLGALHAAVAASLADLKAPGAAARLIASHQY